MTESPSSGRTVLIDGTPLPDVLTEKMIHDVVHGFYDRIRADALLGPIFNGAIEPHRWPEHLARMCDFWSSMLLRTSRYDGRPLPAHLKFPELGEPHFRQWLKLFRETVSTLCPPEVEALFMSRAQRVAHSFCLAIAVSRGESSLGIAPIVE
ncbi:group III truncated hemoglobin [Brucella sp. IR073]|uniref:group III truncated hemoglobin n=1 Tax=unclassified Brucella TaxID=2632610 RepID=UPI003B987DE6